MNDNGPSLNEINKWLIIGMRPGPGSEAVTLGSSNELGADRAVLSAIEYPDTPIIPNATIIDGKQTNVFPLINPDDLSRAKAPSGLRGVFISSHGWIAVSPLPQDNKTPEGTDYPGNAPIGPDVDVLPYTVSGEIRQARTVRGVDWSGNIAVTSTTGTFSLQDMNIFGDIGIRSISTSAAVNISNSYYFSDGVLNGLLMDGLSPSSPDPTRGWNAPVDFTQLLTDLRLWREFISNLPSERNFIDDAPDPPSLNIVNKTTPPFVYNIPDAWDTNNDGIIIIDIGNEDTEDDFEVVNSDWVIEGTGNKLIIFRVRGEANMQITNSSIMLGQQFTNAIGSRKTGVLFTKVFPDEQGSTDSLFQLSNVVMNGIGLWDLNTIDGDENNINTEILHSNTQGCGQFISGFVQMQNVRWIHCDIMSEGPPHIRGIFL